MTYFLIKSNVISSSAKALPKQASPWFNRETGDYFAFGKIFFSFMHALLWDLKKCLYPLPLDIYPSIPWVTNAAKGMGFMLVHLVLAGASVGLLFLWKRGRLLALGSWDSM